MIHEDVLAEADFRYVRNLPDSERRAVAFYEYWRECKYYREVVTRARADGVFDYKEGQGRAYGEEFQRRTAWFTDQMIANTRLFPVPIIGVLSKFDGFPDKPFRASSQPSDADWRTVMGAAPGVSNFFWHTLAGIREHHVKKGGVEMALYDPWGYESAKTTLSAISIPWGLTDKEIVESFRNLVPRLRPDRFREPQRAGRRGRGANSGAVDMLRQLSAYRLDRSGVGFGDGGKVAEYGSVKGWLKAIKSATIRIEGLSVKPLFDDLTDPAV